MEKLTAKNFITFTREDITRCPNGNFFNNLQEFRSPIGVRVEETHTTKVVYDIIPDMVMKFVETDGLSIHYNITLKEFIDLCGEGNICINDKIKNRKDEVQRGQVIAPSVASKLIVSIINGDDAMPEISVIISEDGSILYILDGLQRTSTICNFFKTNGLKLTKTNTLLDGYTWDDFPAEIKREVMNRTISLKITCSAMIPHRASIFRILNTTSTKMSNGELLNTKYWNTVTMKLAVKMAHTAPFTTMFSNEDARGNILDDSRFETTSQILNVLAIKEVIEGNIAPSRCSSVSTFAKEYIMKNADRTSEDIETDFDDLAHILFVIKRNFPIDLCNKIQVKGVTTSGKKGYPAGYPANARNGKVCIAYLSSLYYAVSMLIDAFETRLSSDVKEEMAAALDTLFGDKLFALECVKQNNGKTAIDRTGRVMKTIINVLDKYGITHEYTM